MFVRVGQSPLPQELALEETCPIGLMFLQWLTCLAMVGASRVTKEWVGRSCRRRSLQMSDHLSNRIQTCAHVETLLLVRYFLNISWCGGPRKWPSVERVVASNNYYACLWKGRDDSILSD
jgi:hypothetical protein